MTPRTNILAASAALAMGMAFAPIERSPVRKHALGKKHRKSAKATKAAKLHAMQRKARRTQRANSK